VKINKKVFWLSALLILILALSLTACSGGESSPATTSPAPVSPTTSTTVPAPPPTPTPTALGAQDIAKNMLAAAGQLTSYEYDINMMMDMTMTAAGPEGSGTPGPGASTQNTHITSSGNGAANVTAKEAQMSMNMDVEVPGQGKMSMPMATYLVDGWQYMNISIPSMGEQWMKMKVEAGSYAAKDDLAKAMELLQSASDITLKSHEDVDGTSCYVLEIEPDSADLSEWLKSLQGYTGMMGSQTDGLDYAKLIKDMSFREWIIRDSFLLKKIEMTATVILSEEDLARMGQGLSSMTMDMSQIVKMTSFNQPVSIVLPPESQNAREVSAQP
jgi:hypothetical protein